MGMLMVRCPSPKPIASFLPALRVIARRFSRSAVFFGNTHCPVCRANHNWFAREAWVEEPVAPPAKMFSAVRAC